MHPLVAFAAEAFCAALAPARCAACDRSVAWLTVFCESCAASIEPIRKSTPGLVAAFVYGGPIEAAILRFKYRGRPDLARPLGDLLYAAVEARADERAIVVPVPLHPSRLAERGYNQSALLAGRVARRLRAPCRPLLLARTRPTAAQATLAKEARLANVADAFAVRSPTALPEAPTVLLVDDVHTTGATLAACSRVLEDRGAGRVVCAVLASAS